jgi:hypothetical protein
MGYLGGLGRPWVSLGGLLAAVGVTGVSLGGLLAAFGVTWWSQMAPRGTKLGPPGAQEIAKRAPGPPFGTVLKRFCVFCRSDERRVFPRRFFDVFWVLRGLAEVVLAHAG